MIRTRVLEANTILNLKMIRDAPGVISKGTNCCSMSSMAIDVRDWRDRVPYPSQLSCRSNWRFLDTSVRLGAGVYICFNVIYTSTSLNKGVETQSTKKNLIMFTYVHLLLIFLPLFKNKQKKTALYIYILYNPLSHQFTLLLKSPVKRVTCLYPCLGVLCAAPLGVPISGLLKSWGVPRSDLGVLTVLTDTFVRGVPA